MVMFLKAISFLSLSLSPSNSPISRSFVARMYCIWAHLGICEDFILEFHKLAKCHSTFQPCKWHTHTLPFEPTLTLAHNECKQLAKKHNVDQPTMYRTSADDTDKSNKRRKCDTATLIPSFLAFGNAFCWLAFLVGGFFRCIDFFFVILPFRIVLFVFRFFPLHSSRDI